MISFLKILFPVSFLWPKLTKSRHTNSNSSRSIRVTHMQIQENEDSNWKNPKNRRSKLQNVLFAHRLRIKNHSLIDLSSGCERLVNTSNP